MTVLDTETIAAIATPMGKGGVGIIRLSGNRAREIGEKITQQTLTVRHAHYGNFHSLNSGLIDQGISLYFKAPHSFTGEDVVELQGHGGPIIMDMLLRETLALGARMARPGEFSERAFLNDKIDLAQAEAIADLIDSASEAAAKSALNSLQGSFSIVIHELVESLITLRIYVEAAIDFPEEEIDFLNDGHVKNELNRIIAALNKVYEQAKQGTLLREGMTVVIAGKPNAGKSSLLNSLAERDAAIVTAIEGTTRDVLREHIQIDGMPLHIIDTAGLRDSPDEVEQEGIRRAWLEIDKADHVLFVVDSNMTKTDDVRAIWPEFVERFAHPEKISLVRNKCDLSGLIIGKHQHLNGQIQINISAKDRLGIPALRDHLKQCMGFTNQQEGQFIARRRHLDALDRAKSSILNGQHQLLELGAGELLAEDLRLTQQYLSEITGEFTSDDLLGRIFTSFCIGK